MDFLKQCIRKESETMKYKTIYSSPLGEILLISDRINLTGVWIEGQKYEKNLQEEIMQKDDLEIFIRTKM